MRSYSLLCIDTCHRRGVSAMGGMSALIPIKNDPEANQIAIDMVRQDKEREAGDGHDGTWVAHPGLVPVALEVFDRLMPTPNQIGKMGGVHIQAEDLLRVPVGTITAKGVQQNIAVALGYLEAWLRGIGCVPLFNLMEDAATAEISRAQLWQWVHHKTTTEEGRVVDVAYCNELLDGELEKARIRLGDGALMSYVDAADLVRSLIKEPTFTEFLTLPAYARVLAAERVAPPQQAA